MMLTDLRVRRRKSCPRGCCMRRVLSYLHNIALNALEIVSRHTWCLPWGRTQSRRQLHGFRKKTSCLSWTRQSALEQIQRLLARKTDTIEKTKNVTFSFDIKKMWGYSIYGVYDIFMSVLWTIGHLSFILSFVEQHEQLNQLVNINHFYVLLPIRASKTIQYKISIRVMLCNGVWLISLWLGVS